MRLLAQIRDDIWEEENPIGLTVVNNQMGKVFSFELQISAAEHILKRWLEFCAIGNAAALTQEVEIGVSDRGEEH